MTDRFFFLSLTTLRRVDLLDAVLSTDTALDLVFLPLSPVEDFFLSKLFFDMIDNSKERIKRSKRK